jgi:hypothetical protein
VRGQWVGRGDIAFRCFIFNCSFHSLSNGGCCRCLWCQSGRLHGCIAAIGFFASSLGGDCSAFSTSWKGDIWRVGAPTCSGAGSCLSFRAAGACGCSHRCCRLSLVTGVMPVVQFIAVACIFLSRHGGFPFHGWLGASRTSRPRVAVAAVVPVVCLHHCCACGLSKRKLIRQCV